MDGVKIAEKYEIEDRRRRSRRRRSRRRKRIVRHTTHTHLQMYTGQKHANNSQNGDIGYMEPYKKSYMEPCMCE